MGEVIKLRPKNRGSLVFLMRFLWKLVSCCYPAVRPAVPTTPTRSEEARSPAGSERVPCTKRRRLTGSSSVAQWRPSLCAISENNIVPSVVGKAAGSGKKVSGKTGSRARFRVRSYGDEFRRASVPMTFPAFSPTAFVF